jgi:hypothetical protein
MTKEEAIEIAKKHAEEEIKRVSDALDRERKKPGYYRDRWMDPTPQIPGPGELALGIFYDPDRYKPKPKNNK